MEASPFQLALEVRSVARSHCTEEPSLSAAAAAVQVVQFPSVPLRKVDMLVATFCCTAEHQIVVALDPWRFSRDPRLEVPAGPFRLVSVQVTVVLLATLQLPLGARWIRLRRVGASILLQVPVFAVAACTSRVARVLMDPVATCSFRRGHLLGRVAVT